MSDIIPPDWVPPEYYQFSVSKIERYYDQHGETQSESRHDLRFAVAGPNGKLLGPSWKYGLSYGMIWIGNGDVQHWDGAGGGPIEFGEYDYWRQRRSRFSHKIPRFSRRGPLFHLVPYEGGVLAVALGPCVTLEAAFFDRAIEESRKYPKMEKTNDEISLQSSDGKFARVASRAFIALVLFRVFKGCKMLENCNVDRNLVDLLVGYCCSETLYIKLGGAATLVLGYNGGCDWVSVHLDSRS